MIPARGQPGGRPRPDFGLGRLDQGTEQPVRPGEFGEQALRQAPRRSPIADPQFDQLGQIALGDRRQPGQHDQRAIQGQRDALPGCGKAERLIKVAEPVMGGGSRDVKKAQQLPGEFVVMGTSFPQNGAPRGRMEFGYALTMGCPKELWERWLSDNKDTPMVLNGLIFAHDSERSTVSEAREKEALRSGTLVIATAEVGISVLVLPWKKTKVKLFAGNLLTINMAQITYLFTHRFKTEDDLKTY